MARVLMYAYEKCGTCRKALKWLKAAGVSVDVVSVVETPPGPTELARIRDLAGVSTRALFNTSGQSYRLGGWKEKWDSVSDEAALQALAEDGKLIKRPIVVGEDFALVGFRAEAFAQHLG